MQSISKITIPELEMYDFSSMNAVKALFLLYGYEISQLKQKYPSNNIGNLYSYKSYILEKILHTVSTYIVIVEESQDYISAASILRVLIDNISVYHFIYHTGCKDEMLLRHYLYILDGIIQKIDIASRHTLRHSNKISKQEYENLFQRLSYMNDNLNSAKDFCIKSIKNLDIYNKQKDIIDKLIKNCVWKYKSLDKTKGYSWSDLHALLPFKSTNLLPDFCDYLSHSIHGLSMSNLEMSISDKDLYEPLSNNIILILNFIHESMVTDFDVDSQYLLYGFTQSPNFKAYFSFCSESYKKRFISDIESMHVSVEKTNKNT